MSFYMSFSDHDESKEDDKSTMKIEDPDDGWFKTSENTSEELWRQFSIEETQFEGKKVVITVRPHLSLSPTSFKEFLPVKGEDISTVIVRLSLYHLTLSWRSTKMIEAAPNPGGFSSPKVLIAQFYSHDWQEETHRDSVVCWKTTASRMPLGIISDKTEESVNENLLH